MILVDASVWVEHLRTTDSLLVGALENDAVLVHPFVIGELACGNIHNRREVLDLLSQLPVASSATNEEALTFIEARRIVGSGIGFVDVHLLASTAMHGTARLWTRDRSLAAVAAGLNLAYAP